MLILELHIIDTGQNAIQIVRKKLPPTNTY
uniref:Uncharacterized protein n=1 Tax=Arundo donax TaxID=35708 RepID=A0A0A8Z036_ARUDO